MCDTCGCNITPGNKHLLAPGGKLSRADNGNSAISVLQKLLSENDHQAAHNRAHFDQHGVLAVNLMSSPGSGKTSLLEHTIETLSDRYRIAVIEGDLETENDAERIRAKGVTAIQITTGSACHLDAHMVRAALHQINLQEVDIVFIENVGNLVCPASFDLGQHRNIVLLSVAEGDDKPAKYPVMFRAADVVLLTKVDLLHVLDDFEPLQAEYHIRQLANDAPVMQTSVRQPIQITSWINWLEEEFSTYRERLTMGETIRPAIQPDDMQFHQRSHSQSHQDR